jgi:DNA-binding NtrC family response regulator
MNAHLFIRTGPNSGEMHQLGSGAVTLGRGRTCGIRLADPFVSREHFRIELRGHVYWLVDLGSMNMTAVNGIPTSNKQLEAGDEIHLGSTRILFLSGSAPSSAAARVSEISRTMANIFSVTGPRFEMVGASDAMRKLHTIIERVAPLDTTVLILGESGVGKELVAKAIHQNGPRATGPLVNVNCASIPRELAESELFGHEKGAFTGAHAQRLGKFELANGGTLFLDEIGELAPDCQAKLLRVIEERKVTRVGGERDYKVNVRLVAATHQNLHEMVKSGRFRKDLLFRLEVISIQVPPLRERGDDIQMLARHFLDRLREKVGRRIEGITPQAIERLKAHDWPGNVRELKNVIERAVIMGSGTNIDAPDLALHALDSEAGEGDSLEPLEAVVEKVARQHIERAMRLAGGNKKKAAQMLGVPRSSLYDFFKKYGLSDQ